MLDRFVAIFAAVLLPGIAAAAGWSGYGNARFGYVIDVPPGFSAIREAQNGDGGKSTTAEGHAALAVWGSNLIDQTFARDASSRISDAAAEGWVIGYRMVTAHGASWSGTRGGRILYVHAIPRCDDQAAFVQIEYDATAKTALDPIVSRVSRSLRASSAC